MKKIFISVILVFFSFISILSADENGNAVRIDLLKTGSTWTGDEIYAYPCGQPEITIFKGIIPPGASSSIHKHPTIGAYVILKGELTVITKNNDIVRAKAGEAYAEVIDQWHYGINEGTETVELIFFFAGAEGIPNSIAKCKRPERDDDDCDHDCGGKHRGKHCGDD